MNPEELRRILHWDSCVECGECLTQCRYLDLTRDQSMAEIRKINRGRTDDSMALKGCTSCLACNAFCPHDAHPYERIHYLWHYRLEKEGIPWRAAYMMPMNDPNFRMSLRYFRAEKALLQRWDTPEPRSSTVLYPGCNLLTLPRLATGRLFEGLTVWGKWDLCCGEMYYRMGALHTVQRIAEKLTRFYADRGIEEMVFVCPACFNMFRHILPEQFGARFDFELTFYDQWIRRKIERDELSFREQLGGSVVVHDSCQARALGGSFMERQRDLLRRCGLDVREMAQNREHGLCCGMAAGANQFSVVDLSRAAVRGLQALCEAEGDEVVTYCTGCLLTFSCVRLVSPYRKPVRHSLEYLHAALGEPLPRHQSIRAAQLLAGIFVHSLTRYASRRRIYLH